MKSTDILLKEHDLILKKVAGLGIDLQYPLKLRLSAVKRGLEFIEKFVDEYHHMREEEIYFEWMDTLDKVYKDGPVKCMFDEHDMGRKYITGAKDAMEEFLSGSAEAEKDVKDNVRLYIAMIIDHINKENTMIYPMAEKLNDEQGGGDEFILPRLKEHDEKNFSIVRKYLG